MIWSDSYTRDCSCGNHVFRHPTHADMVSGDMHCPICLEKFEIDSDDRNAMIALLVFNIDRLELANARLEARITRLKSPFARLGI